MIEPFSLFIVMRKNVLFDKKVFEEKIQELKIINFSMTPYYQIYFRIHL
jgi:hypothetical protein